MSGYYEYAEHSLPLTSNDVQSSNSLSQRSAPECKRKFSVVYGKVSSRKHKKWEADGILLCRERTAILQTESGTNIAQSNAFSKKGISELCDGCRLIVGGFEVEIQEELTDSSSSEKVIPEGDVYQKSPPLKKKFQPLCRQFVQPFCKDGEHEAVEFVVNQDDLENGVSPIVLDFRIASHLRQHQKDGIRFLYQKLKDPGGGVILADEMGLGKTVQTISLITTLLKATVTKGSVFTKKYLLIVPSTLIGNWLFEFAKWIPFSRSLVFQVKKASEFSNYLRSVRCSPIALMSYEMAACIGESLTQVQFALVVCDEAHRLKNAKGRMHHLIDSLNTERRLLLTGTPLQNGSDELFSLLNLARPDAFSTIGEFRKLLDGTSDDQNLRELMGDTLLRRTSEVNIQYLPQKCEYILFCRLSELQKKIYECIREYITNDHLLLIDMLKKLCNHPSLLYQSVVKKLDDLNSHCSFYAKVLDAFPSSFSTAPLLVSDSGKLSVFMEMMCSFRECNEKVVIVSNFTKTLDMLETLCNCLYFRIFRLDGSVQQQKRMQIINDFNSTPETNSVFLLSTKTGGVGLNLTGASRLILYDSEWNPAVDVQAMARIWRDGQVRPCHIYRLVTTGAIDEKILQRQIMKTGLSTVIEVEEVATMARVEFSAEDLYDVFNCDTTTLCNTHDLMECNCQGCGLLITERNAIDLEEQPTEADIVAKSEDKCDENLMESNLVGKYGQIDESGADFETVNKVACNDLYSVINDKEVITAEIDQLSKTLTADIPLSVSLAALLQWRHYAHEHVEQFELFKAQAGLGSSTLNDVTFAMKIIRNY